MSWDIVQFDSETSGRDPHLTDFLCVQFGNKAANIQIVVDTKTIPIEYYKDVLENKTLIAHNGKFDLQFCYKHGIYPTKVWDTMIVEQVLHLGYSNKFFHYGLKDVAKRRLGIDIDKTVRGEIIWRGLDTSVIKYAAGDVVYLEDIREQQLQDCKNQKCEKAAELENLFVPVIAYLEWCGIKLDENKWKLKMEKNQKNLNDSLTKLNNWVINNKDSRFKKYVNQNLQLDLFSTEIPKPECTINWASPAQVIPIFQMLGFNTKTDDKKTGESKDSVVEKLLAMQKGINDDFLANYLNYKAAAKECSTYGQNYLDAINPVTGRIHTTFWQLGAASGRMSCGSRTANTDLASYKHLIPSKCTYVQIQNLPADEETREAFVSEEGNLFTSADYSAMESRLGADIYDEPEMLKEFLEGSGDMHSLCAKLVFHEELKDIDVKDVKKLRPDLRKKVKPIEFSQQFGGGAKAVASSMGCSIDEAQKFVEAYANGFKGITAFKAKGAQFVKSHGYVLMCKQTGHKMYWEDFKKWRQIEDMPYWERKQTLSSEALREHQMAGAKWERMSLNAPTQGCGAILIKLSAIYLFHWLLRNNLIEKVKLCDMVHDEICIEYPKELKDTVEPMLVKCMETAASKICKKVPIPAEASTGTFWIH